MSLGTSYKVLPVMALVWGQNLFWLGSCAYETYKLFNVPNANLYQTFFSDVLITLAKTIQSPNPWLNLFEDQAYK